LLSYRPLSHRWRGFPFPFHYSQNTFFWPYDTKLHRLCDTLLVAAIRRPDINW
jgi:hypothetical protein